MIATTAISIVILFDLKFYSLEFIEKNFFTFFAIEAFDNLQYYKEEKSSQSYSDLTCYTLVRNSHQDFH